MKTLTLLCLCFGFACGGSETTTETPDQSGNSCDQFTVGDPCITEANLAACREREAQCPGEVMQLESCPLQFSCPPVPPG